MRFAYSCAPNAAHPLSRHACQVVGRGSWSCPRHQASYRRQPTVRGQPVEASSVNGSDHADGSTWSSSIVSQLVKGGKVSKTAVTRLKVQDLRHELALRGLPDDGLKSALVERLLAALMQETAAATTTTSLRSQEGSSGASTSRARPAAVAPVSTVDVAPAAQALTPSETKDSSNGIGSRIRGPSSQATAPGQPSSAMVGSNSPRTLSPSGAVAASSGEDVADPASSTGIAVTWLGTSSGAPTGRRNVSSIAYRVPGSTVLVDTGEGTFNQLLRANIDLATINGLCITHMHGDHCFGLLGVVRAVAAARAAEQREGEVRPLRIFGPPGVHAEVVAVVKAAGAPLTLPLDVYQYVPSSQQVAAPRTLYTSPDKEASSAVTLMHLPPDEDQGPHSQGAGTWSEGRFYATAGLTWTLPGLGDCSGVIVVAAQLQHRVPCWGYVFQEVRSSQQQHQTAGGAPARGRKVVLLGDTCDSTAIAEIGAMCDLLSHEATFAAGMEEKAGIAQHSTATMAGKFARDIGAKALVLTHFSARYDSLDPQGGRGGTLMRELDSADDMDIEAFDNANVESLLREARRAYGSNRVVAAHDLFTVKVPPIRAA